LRLTGELPTLAEIHLVADAPDGAPRKAAYEAQVDRYLASPRFARQMFRFWQDTLKLGDAPALDTAPAFVTKLIVDDRSILDALPAQRGTCTSYDPSPGQSARANGGTARVGVGLLTHRGMNAQFFSTFGFRRVRWVQEPFACTAFPAEIAETATAVGG